VNTPAGVGAVPAYVQTATPHPTDPTRRVRDEADPSGAVKLTLTDPDTAPMTRGEHAQAVDALASLIVSWLRRRAHGRTDGADTASTVDATGRANVDRDSAGRRSQEE
jgi:hypothetical protein